MYGICGFKGRDKCVNISTGNHFINGYISEPSMTATTVRAPLGESQEAFVGATDVGCNGEHQAVAQRLAAGPSDGKNGGSYQHQERYQPLHVQARPSTLSAGLFQPSNGCLRCNAYATEVAGRKEHSWGGYLLLYRRG